MSAQDIRLSVHFPDHPKTVKLERRLGFQGVRSLLSLWAWAAQNRPDGNLGGANDRQTTVRRPLDEEDIEIVARWPGEPGAFVATLVALGWLDQTEHGYLLHEWVQHNPWVAAATNRSDKARFSRVAKTHPDIYNYLCERGIREIGAEEFARLKAGWPLRERPTNVGETFEIRSTDVQRPFDGRSAIVEAALTPSPSPSPSPELKQERVPLETARSTAATRALSPPDHPPDRVTAPGAIDTAAKTPVTPEDGARATGETGAIARDDLEVPVAGITVGRPVVPTLEKPVLEPAGAVPEEARLAGASGAGGVADPDTVAGRSLAALRPARRRAPPAEMPAAPDWLPQELWDRWQAHRGALKKPLSADGALLTLARLEKAKGFGHDPAELLKTAIANGWQGCVFPDTHYRAAVVRAPSAPREGSRPALREPPADPAAYRKTDGFAAELALEEA